MSYATETTLRDLALAYPAALGVLELHRLDYCCGGQQSLAEACEGAGLDAEQVLLEIQAVKSAQPVSVATDTLGALMAHIVETHHAFTRTSLARIDRLMERVLLRHGAAHPELADLNSCVRSLAADLVPHLRKEEEVLFPYVEGLEGHVAQGTELPTACFGSVAAPISVMGREHEAVGDLLKQARSITRDYACPADACSSFSLLYQELEALESDLMRHIHLENNILFPRALRLADEVHPGGN
ncbi:iron-sulfur cluster repair di-iron protein [Methyloterricola oryzae]|uniref:iron-sulfur cluster repair di-iron protein n=1 Tax=Methyloterricola oryzae TaxID=1495050 RepID=UPI000A8CA033|nr:iron-sulfur cluster repair di-iron protein [Methyloterricola oryzae]